jgi:hypothetical protein
MHGRATLIAVLLLSLICLGSAPATPPARASEPVATAPAAASMLTPTSQAAAEALIAELDLRDPPACIPEAGAARCDPVRDALWLGNAEAWAAFGVTDPGARASAVFDMRYAAGDPASRRDAARSSGIPYLVITQVKFVGTAEGQIDEFVEVANLGGAAQNIAGWTLRSPARGEAFQFPNGFEIPQGWVCKVYTGRVQGGACGTLSFDQTDVWPDGGGQVVLANAQGGTEALSLYSADLANQPPPPNLQLCAAGSGRCGYLAWSGLAASVTGAGIPAAFPCGVAAAEDGPLSIRVPPTVEILDEVYFCFPSRRGDQPIDVEVRLPGGVIRQFQVAAMDLGGRWFSLPGDPLGTTVVTASQGGSRATASFEARAASVPRILVRPQSGRAGTEFQVLLAGFTPGSRVPVHIFRGDTCLNGPAPCWHFVTSLPPAQADRAGQADYRIVAERSDPPGDYRVITVPGTDEPLQRNSRFTLER